MTYQCKSTIFFIQTWRPFIPRRNKWYYLKSAFLVNSSRQVMWSTFKDSKTIDTIFNLLIFVWIFTYSWLIFTWHVHVFVCNDHGIMRNTYFGVRRQQLLKKEQEGCIMFIFKCSRAGVYIAFDPDRTFVRGINKHTNKNHFIATISTDLH